jgi:glutathionyl-hydroquinone reductase
MDAGSREYGCLQGPNLFFRSLLFSSIATQAAFASQQDQYEKAVTSLFAHLDKLEALLKDSSGPFLLGAKLTELDIQLYTTIVRFDVVY